MMDNIRSFLFFSFFVIACGNHEMVTHTFPDGTKIQIREGQTGAFLTMSALPDSMTLQIHIQNWNNGQTVASLNVQESTPTFISLYPGDYQISGYANNGEWECWADGVRFQITEGDPQNLFIEGRCHEVAAGTGVAVNLTLNEVANLLLSLNVSSPAGTATPSAQAEVARYNLTNDSSVDGVINSIYIGYINGDASGDITNCEIRDGAGTTIFDQAEMAWIQGWALTGGVPITIAANTTYTIRVVCDTTSQMDWLQVRIEGVATQAYIPNGQLPVLGNWLSYQ